MSEQFKPLPPAPGAASTSDKRGIAAASLALSLFGFCAAWLPGWSLLFWPSGVTSIVLGILGLKSKYKSMAIGGIIISVMTLLLILLPLILNLNSSAIQSSIQP